MIKANKSIESTQSHIKSSFEQVGFDFNNESSVQSRMILVREFQREGAEMEKALSPHAGA